MELAPGLTKLPGGTAWFVPAVGKRDVLRVVASAGQPVSDPDAYADAVLAAVVADTAERLNRPSESLTSEWFVHRQARDVARVRAIAWLQETHRPPHERIPADPLDKHDEPARSRLFARLDVDHVHGIDKTAAVVGGSE